MLKTEIVVHKTKVPKIDMSILKLGKTDKTKGNSKAHWIYLSHCKTSRNYLRTKVTPDFHLTYSKNGGNLGLKLK